jgi:hypothetical protein
MQKHIQTWQHLTNQDPIDINHFLAMLSPCRNWAMKDQPFVGIDGRLHDVTVYTAQKSHLALFTELEN